MAVSADIRKTVLQTVNEVQVKLGVNTTTTLGETKLSTLLLNLLNDTLDEMSDHGDWPQMYREIEVMASSSVGTYKIQTTDDHPWKNVYEIVWGDDIASLEVRTIEDIRRLQRLASFGTPRQFAIVGVSGINATFRIYPIPNTASITADTKGGVFDIAGYVKPPLYDTSATAASTTIEFPSRVVVQGLYAKALLEEAGGEPTQQSERARQRYIEMRNEALNRFTADTGTDVFFTPTGSRYA